jgi:phospholipase/carboxylesterase
VDEPELVNGGPAFEALGLVHRVRLPDGEGPHPVLVMVHGLNGNEDVTWVFARQAGPEWSIASPRAPFPGDGGYTWLKTRDLDNLSSYADGLAALARYIDGLPKVYPADPQRPVLLGFSQGAAMSYLFGSSHLVKGIAALSGFLPPLSDEQLKAFAGVPILILHGTDDETVPIDVARRDRDRLIKAGANVTYLEAKTGHKVTTPQIHELRRWLAERLRD